MDLLVLDFETFYDQAYSLSKMSTEAYVRDPRFETILLGVKVNETPGFWLLPDRAEHFLKTEVDWKNTAVVAHHAHFDGLILSHHYDCRPAFWIDTLSMARVVDGPKAGNSLEELCARHGIGAKGDYVRFAKGKRGADFSAAETREYGAYCVNDCEKEYLLANLFLPKFPQSELALVDLTVRMFTEPTFVGDVAKLARAVASERARKVELLRGLGAVCPACKGEALLASLLGESACRVCAGSGVDKRPFSSSDKFANLLQTVGVEPPMKRSNTTGELIPAFAKTDPGMQELLEHEEELVRALAQARLAVKSTIVETRAESYQHMSERGPLPVYIKYGGAHTLRWAGGDGTNWQNLSNSNKNRPEMAALKESVMAPPGHRIVVADSGQGEARTLAWLANHHELVRAFAEGRDVYSEFASDIYGRPVDRKRVAEDYIPGQVGKVSVLGLGFGMGWFKLSIELLKGMLGNPPIQFTMKDLEALHVDANPFLNNTGKVQKVSEMPSRLELNDRFIHCIVAEHLVRHYRGRNQPILAFWDLMDKVINAMIRGEEMVFGAHGVLRTSHERIHLPTGLELRYRGIERDERGESSYFNGRERTKLYGGLLTENIVQCLHRCAVAEQMLEISQVLKVALMTHDDVACVVPEEAAEDALRFMVQVMGRAPEWARGLPLVGEGGIGQTYAEAG